MPTSAIVEAKCTVRAAISLIVQRLDGLEQRAKDASIARRPGRVCAFRGVVSTDSACDVTV